ncbi:complement C2-like isoform X2 [Hyperolius riggenbachi]|uniref:complement C2-like isoform X2 n=1 Tax=Hyperolius riggenbachi TaxID=752182 RepID=UPI0035A3C298
MGTWCTMPLWSLKAALLLVSLLSVAADSAVQCPPNLGYPGGLTQLSDWLNVGSIAKFMCPEEEYAWPVSSRKCQGNGEWSAMTSSSGRKIRTISCKKMRCPDPSNFENGYYYPRGVFQVGSNVTFVCNDGYALRGSMVRTCRKNAKWSGETAVCDDGAGHCADPGVPPGAVKSGSRYDIDESVSYKCITGLNLMGSAKRTCLENRHWSGSEVSCEYPYAFDLPEDVGQSFAGSLSGVVQTSEKKQTVGRTVKVQKDGILNVYLLLDASRSVGEQNFKTSKECAEILVNGLGKFDMTVQFGILSYATDPEVVIRVHDQDSDDPDHVLEMIKDKLLYSAHADKTGTNIKGALKAVYDMMSFQGNTYKDKDVWNSVHHVIILLTDGKANMGGSPVDTIKSINNYLNISENREDYLDIYAFGIGDEIKPEDLQQIASNKRDEKHVFILKDTDELKAAFQKILEIQKYGEMCGLNIESPDPHENFPHPWNVLVKSPSTSPCFGSLISSQWVLTAAHCFKEDVLPEAYLMEIGDHTYKGSEIKIHECYKLRRKEAIGVREDYDYDVALIKLDKKVTFSKKARPICVPCTEPANRAMKQAKSATCDNHRNGKLY